MWLGVRPKVVISVLLAAAGLLGAFALLSKLTSQLTSPGLPAEAVVSPSSNSTTTRVQKAAVVASESAVAPAPRTVTPQTNHAQYVYQRIAELNALAMNDDSASLDTILSELRNPDRRIRKGALEATIQFEDRAAIPRLKEIASETEDEDEKSELLAAADYLNLPSLTEYLAQQEAQREASGITNLPVVPRTNRIRVFQHGGRPRPQQQPVSMDTSLQTGS